MRSVARAPWGRTAQILALAVGATVAVTALPSIGDAQQTTTAVASAPAGVTEYRIGPLDKLDINVFEVKDLTLEKVQVDANGQLLLPLIGVVDAKGKTASELSAEIATRLDANFMQDAQVSVFIEESASQKVTVEGAVTEAGVFQLHGSATLLQAIAMAKGASRTADTVRVAIFRVSADGTRQHLVYDVRNIEKGRQPDPPVFGGDVVVVGESGSKNAEQAAIALAPLVYALSIFHF